MNNKGKIGLITLSIFFIIAIILFFMEYTFFAIASILAGIVSCFVLISKDEKQEEPSEIIEEIVEEKIENLDYLAHTLDNLFKSVDKYYKSEVEDPQYILRLHNEIIADILSLNDYEIDVLLKAYPDFYLKLNKLNTNWVDFKENIKYLNEDLIKNSIHNTFNNLKLNATNDEIEAFLVENIKQEIYSENVKQYTEEILNHHLASYKGISSETAKEPVASFDQLKAPEDVMNLVWYKDGPLANYAKGEFKKVVDDENFTFEYEIVDNEPSLISVCDEIEKGEIKGEVPLSYAEMSKNARYQYIKWLNNMENVTSIAFPQLFVMGIERFICLTENKKEIPNILMELKEILKKNKEMENHIQNLIYAYVILNKDRNITNLLLESNINKISHNLILAIINKVPLSTELIYQMANYGNFKNKRYIKMYPEEFRNVMRQILYKNYAMEKLPLSDVFLDRENPLEIVLNTNNSIKTAKITVPSLKDEEKIKELIFNLLKETHETLKENLRIERLNKNKE